MQRGNPYHDARGRFTSANGVCGDKAAIKSLAEMEAETWQENYSEIDPEGEYRDYEGSYDDALEAELKERAQDCRGEVEEIYNGYMSGMCEKIRSMNYEDLKGYVESDYSAEHDREVVEKLSKNSDLCNVDIITGVAAEDIFSSPVVDLRYRRIVAKCNGNHKLFEMAMDEDEKYGLGGYAENYATQKIKAKGLEEEYTYYKMAKGAYERGEQALAKSPDEYKDMKSYIIAKVKYYKHVDEKLKS